MDIGTVTTVFGWMTVINLVIYTLTALLIMLARDWVVRLQARMLGVAEAEWPAIYAAYLGRYKLMILVFNLVPYLTLRIVAG